MLRAPWYYAGLWFAYSRENRSVMFAAICIGWDP
jgi:hypothetical protein